MVELNKARWSRQGRAWPTSRFGGGEGYTFDTLLGAAHEAGLVSLEVVDSHFTPTFAVVTTMATFADGSSFTAVGEGSVGTGNLKSNMEKYVATMAHTRSVVRALRLALNADKVATDEVGVEDIEGEATTYRKPAAPRSSTTPTRSAAPYNGRESVNPPPNSGDGYVCEMCAEQIVGSGKYTAAQTAGFSYRAEATKGQILCFDCRKSQDPVWAAGLKKA